MNIFTTIFAFLAGSLSSVLLKINNLIFHTIRIDSAYINAFCENLKEEKAWRFTSYETYNPKRSDGIENSFYYYKSILFWFYLNETNLQAGYDPKEKVLTLVTFRPMVKKLREIVANLSQSRKIKNSSDIHVNCGTYSYSKINSLGFDDYTFDKIKLRKDVKDEIKELTGEFFSGKRKKLGIILHGMPGCGKTTIIKTLACENKTDIYVPIFSNEHDNSKILSMFRYLPNDESKIIVALEDFDSYFKGREPRKSDCKFSFDVILNILDGLYLNTDNIMFIMTANNLDDIDIALRNRPSRFDYILEVKPPTAKERLEILKDIEDKELREVIVKMTENKSAAIVCEINKRMNRVKKNHVEEADKIIKSFEHEIKSKEEVAKVQQTTSTVGGLEEVKQYAAKYGLHDVRLTKENGHSIITVSCK